MPIDANRECLEKPGTSLDVRASIRAFISKKLGRCPFCMRWSALGMLFSWIAIAVAALVGGPTWLAVTLTAAVAFTTLYVLHVTTFTSRVMRGPERSVDVERRRFIVTSAKVGAAVLAATVGDSLIRGVALATGREPDPGNSLCAKLCQALFPPGPERGRCISEGAHGRGICFEGTCVPPPPATGQFKPKETQQAKLQALLAGTPTSSSLAGNFFHIARRFLRHQAPANDIETTMFPVFAALPETTQEVLRCSVNRFDAVPLEDRVKLFGEQFAGDDLLPIPLEDVAGAFLGEVQGLLLADPSGPRICPEETAGLARPITFLGSPEAGYVTLPVPWINRVLSLRTKEFITVGGGRLALADYTQDEIEQACHPVPGGQLVCEDQTPPCPGPEYEVEGYCLHLVTFVAGDTVTLEGLNFYDVNARVRLLDSAGLTAAEVDARVCGDTETPLTDAAGVVIADSRVKDGLSFTIPTDLPDGIYEIDVVVTNPSDGLQYETPGRPIIRPFIRVLAAFTGRFQINSEKLICFEETSPAILGSDEVGIRMIASVIRSLQADETSQHSFRFGDVDSGDTRTMSELLADFESTPDLLGAIVTIAGYEVDSEDAYKDTINSFWDAYLKYLKEELQAIEDSKLLQDALKDIASAHPILAGIAVGIALAVTAFIAIWAPADPIIHDAIALSRADLLQLTSVSFPGPVGPPYSGPVATAEGIEVQVVDPLEKAPGQCREFRRYRSSEEDSTYKIALRYSRVPGTFATTRGNQTAMAGSLTNQGGARLEVERSASRPPFTFRWQAAADHSSEPKAIRIYDVAGRQRAQLRLGVERAGTTSWDGSDSWGAPLPAGVYFAVLAGAKTEARTRIVLVR